MYSTLAEIQRCCKLVASTSNDYHVYNTQKKEAEMYGAFEFVCEWDAISIYSNKLFYIVCYTSGNILSLYKLRQNG